MTEPAELDVSHAPDPVWTRLSVIWIIPILALIVSLGVAWRSYADRGVEIAILFSDATGIVPGQTVLKYREVEVGRVEAATFTEDLRQVAVSVLVERDIARYLDEEADFWLVRPEVTASGISRLDTVLSGVFIEGSWDAEVGTASTRFIALPAPPAVRSGQEGVSVTLRADDGGTLSDGAPVFFRGVQVGRLGNLRLAEGGDGVEVDAFIEAPHHTRISTATVFWDVSGFSVSLGAQGLRLDVRSLGALVQGGVEFSTLSSGGRPVAPGQRFRLHPDSETAQRSLFAGGLQAQVTLSVLLEDSVRGLTENADVVYRGQTIGQVTGLSLVVDVDPSRGRIVRERIDFAVSPERLGLSATAGLAEVLDFLGEQVDEGLRARIASTGLFGGSLVLEFADVDGAAAATIDTTADPFPVVPAAPADVTDVQATAEGVLSRINALPIEELLNSATTLMSEATGLLRKDGTQEAPDEVLGLIEDIRALVRSPDIAAAPGALRATLDEAQALLAELRAAELDLALAGAVSATSEAAATVSSAAEGVPDLIAALTEVAEGTAALPLDATVTEAQRVLARLGDLLGSDATSALPAQLGGALDELGAVLSELREGGAVENVNAALVSARDAAGSVAAASDELPVLVDQLDRAIAQISATLSAYGERSAFNSETVATMRELRRAAETVGSLARTLERNPNSLIIGR